MYVDVDVLYAYIKPKDWLKSHVSNIIGKYKLITSVISILELELASKRDFDSEFSLQIFDLLAGIKDLHIVPLTKEIAALAAQLRKTNRLNTFDAIHGATALYYKKRIISSDLLFDTIADLKRRDPREF